MPSTIRAKFAIRLSASNAKLVSASLSGPILVAAVLLLQQFGHTEPTFTFIHSNTLHNLA